jgi:hypothetical protein
VPIVEPSIRRTCRNPDTFQRLTGICPEDFDQVLEDLRPLYEEALYEEAERERLDRLHRVGIGPVGLNPGPSFRIENIGQPVHAGLGVDAALWSQVTVTSSPS